MFDRDRARFKPALAAFAAAMSAIALAGCNAVGGLEPTPASPDIYEAVATADLGAKAGVRAKGAGDFDGQPRPQGFTVTGSPGYDASGASSAVTPASGGYNVAFENAPIASVAKSILSDTLGLGLAIDPRVSGNISLSSGRPLNRNELLLALESALRSANASMIKDGAGYRIMPATETAGLGGYDASRAPAPGFGISALPLRHISAENMMKLVDSFAAKPGAVRVDTARNMLIVQGTGEERRVAMETAAAFDQDWMSGQSVGVYPLSSATPEVMIGELQRIMDAGEGGAYKGILQFQAIARMNAVLAISKRPDALRAAAGWIRRLDRADNSATQSRVYHVKYGEAKKLARILNESFSGGASPLSSDDTIEPGAGRLSLNSPGAQQAAGATAGSATVQNAAAPGAPQGPFGSLTRDTFGAAAGGARPNETGNEASGGLNAGAGGKAAGGVHVTADESTNSLLIFADRERFRMIERVLQQLDRPRLQVAIEATIAEVSLNDDLQYGVQYYLQNHQGSIGLSTGTATQVISAVLPGFNLLLGPQTDPRVVLSALSSRTNVKVLSTPSVVALDNQVASIQVGDQVPVSTSQATLVSASNTGLLNSTAFPVTNSIDYRNTGVILRVLPRVSANGNVTLEVEQEISNVVNNSSSGTLTPTISQRHLKSTISVTSNQTVLLGGLISDQVTDGRSGIPVLSTIQYLGDLFATNQSARNRTELIVFIRPRIIADSVDAQSVAEEMRTKMLVSRPGAPLSTKY